MEDTSANNEETLGIVCCYFNHRNYLSRFVNFINFYQKLSAFNNIEIITVESFSASSKYRIGDYVDNPISIYSDQIYWQKEELLNIGIQELLKRNHTYIAWVDADIEFVNSTWVTETISKIKKYKVTHLFKDSYKKLPNTHNHIKASSTVYCFNTGEPDIKRLLLRPGEPGYGYGYHKSLFETFMLYDKAIVGSGDFMNLLGVLFDGDVGNELKNDRFFNGANPKFFEHYMEWITSNGVKLPKVGVCETQILVNYHGTSEKRSYAGRESILKTTNFNPYLDMKVEKTGLSSLSNKPLVKYIYNYFGERGEDDFIKGQEPQRRYMKKIARLINNVDPKFNTQTANPMENLHLLSGMKRSPKVTVRDRVTPTIKQPIDAMIVIAKLHYEYFATTRIVNTPTIVVDKSKFQQTNSIPCKNKGEYGEVYLNFIVENYDNLPDVCVFANETFKNINRKYAYALDSISKSSNGGDTKYTPMGNTTQQAVYLDKDFHLIGRFRRTPHARDVIDSITPSNYTFIEWIEMCIKETPPVAIKHTTTTPDYKTITHYATNNPVTGKRLTYDQTNSFYVGKNKILQHNKTYYEDLLSRVSASYHPEEEHYLTRSWQFIFK